MGYSTYLKDILTVATIMMLLVVGLAIALRSGSVAVGPDRSRLVLGNLSHVVLSVAGGVLALGIIQQFVGFRLSLAW